MTTDNTSNIKETPVGLVRFASLRTPFQGNFAPKYLIVLAFDLKDEAQVASIKELHKLIGMKSGVRHEIDKDTDTPTGFLTVSFNSEFQIPVFDSKGKVISKEQIPLVGKGSKARVQYKVAQTRHGLAKYPLGIQLVDLVEVASKSASMRPVEGGTFDAVNLPAADLGEKPAFDETDI